MAMWGNDTPTTAAPDGTGPTPMPVKTTTTPAPVPETPDVTGTTGEPAIDNSGNKEETS